MSIAPLTGARYLLTGIGLILRPGLRRFVIVPVLVNTLIFAGATAYGLTQFADLIAWLETLIPAWLEWLTWLLWPLFILALLVLVFFTFGLLANLIASPFNGLLAEEVERHLTGRSPSDAGLAELLRDLLPTLVDELRKLGYALFSAVPFLVLFLIPGINVFAPLLWFVYTAWVMAVQYADFPMGNHGLKFRAQRARLRERPFLALGFGAATGALTSVPIVNFLAMPSAVAGATALWVGELASADQDASRGGVD